MADNKTGYFGVQIARPGQPKPYQARVRRGGKMVYLGMFATAEEAALHVARSPEGRAVAAERAAAAAPLTSEEARQQAQAEKLTLLVAENKTGYFGVRLDQPGRSKPYAAQVTRGGKTVYLAGLLRHRRGGGAVHRAVAGREGGWSSSGEPATRSPAQDAGAFLEPYHTIRGCSVNTCHHSSSELVGTRGRGPGWC